MSLLFPLSSPCFFPLFLANVSYKLWLAFNHFDDCGFNVSINLVPTWISCFGFALHCRTTEARMDKSSIIVVVFHIVLVISFYLLDCLDESISVSLRQAIENTDELEKVFIDGKNSYNSIRRNASSICCHLSQLLHFFCCSQKFTFRIWRFICIPHYLFRYHFLD